ncbi:caspase family protein [Ramlibacter sp. G-1-2-2]|uniref:Caspase family protein n=1 Tax=Ramlibacter agri TaxID=2728837 RepID=A0A848H4E9_9BURK|nr:caspase family protein [Ramlibacter agri]NML45377.1 caspase family protein [Ramlibacter agri]
MRILAIHGVGHGDAKTDWPPQWQQAVLSGLQTWRPDLDVPAIEFLHYDSFFEQAPLGAPEVAEALFRLSASGLFHGLTDMMRSRGGLGTALDAVRWTAGMVAQWVALDDLREQLRKHLAAAIQQQQPDVILAHSLGSLLAYDTLRRDEAAGGTLAKDLTFVTFGSQIGNPAVRSVFGGRIEPLASCRFWWHLFNPEDDVFTCPLGLPARARFRQVTTFFDIPGMADHDGAHYLGHEQTTLTVWQDLAASARGSKRAAPAQPANLAVAHRAAVQPKPVELKQKAVLVGVADYADPANKLDGPVNDVFAVSAALQELGFPPDGIRVVLNDRATAEGIRERLKWLLQEAQEGDQLFFFFAGHGAQVPGYGRDSEVDRLDECLVPYDFDWTRGQGISDDELAALYGQLPYKCQFTIMLDCCHAGGMTRGGLKARGLAPPDDIRHRMLRWDRTSQMWLPREQLASPTAAEEKKVARAADRASWLGESGSVRRIGRGTSLWAPSARAYGAAKTANRHAGPYVPMMLEACGENQLAYEYRHGVTAFGAFTYSLVSVLHQVAREQKKPRLSFEQLIARTGKRIATVVPEPQQPQLHCASARRKDLIPGLSPL